MSWLWSSYLALLSQPVLKPYKILQDLSYKILVLEILKIFYIILQNLIRSYKTFLLGKIERERERETKERERMRERERNKNEDR